MSIEKVVETAKGIISGEIGVIEGSRKLSSLRFDVTDVDHDPDFIPFVAIDSESDHIPLGSVRDRWSETGIAKMDLERKETEDHYRKWAIEASEKLLERYASTNT